LYQSIKIHENFEGVLLTLQKDELQGISATGLNDV